MSTVVVLYQGRQVKVKLPNAHTPVHQIVAEACAMHKVEPGEPAHAHWKLVHGVGSAKVGHLGETEL